MKNMEFWAIWHFWDYLTFVYSQLDSIEVLNTVKVLKLAQQIPKLGFWAFEHLFGFVLPIQLNFEYFFRKCYLESSMLKFGYFH